MQHSLPVRLLLNVLCWLVILEGLLIGQQAKPYGRDHPEPAAGQRKALDRLTQTVSSRLPAGPVIPAQRKNYIDDYVFSTMERDHIPHAELSSDTEFLRRVTLDLTGRLPGVETIRKFIRD